MDLEVRCETCVFYHQGYCKFNAPARALERSLVQPAMDKGDWCGEHTVLATSDLGAKYLRTFAR